MVGSSPAPEEAIREPTLAETLDRFIVACQRIHILAEQTEAAIAAWNPRAGGERKYTREEMREACQQNYNAGRAAGGKREQQLEALFQAAKPIFDDVQKTVAGWQRDPELPRHPGTLGWTPSKSKCGVAYAIADALAALAGQTEGERNGG